ncbi:MAG: T9SS type A sorting domain-containing protein [Bacteroidales bacterium]|nr:T9SS type A sorting domain-containing protein [Bacteroidales bacterium]
MKLLYTLILIIGSFLFTPFVQAQPSLSYQRVTNGLDEPDFDEGHTDFVFDDINMDGNVDILSVGDHGSPNFNSAQHGIMVWFGDGNGNFENYMSGNFGYGGIAVGDVNNDGHKDVGYGVHHNYSGTGWGDQLNEVVLGDGTGMNWELWDEGLSSNGETWGMFGTAFADFNNNGFLDLVSVSFGCCAGLHVYLNQQDGSWVQSFGFLNGGSGFLVRTCDINNDGFMDFISSHQYGVAYFGDGTGNFLNNDYGLPTNGNTAISGMDICRMKNTGTYAVSWVSNAGAIEVYGWENSSESWIDYSGNLPTSGVWEISQLHDMNIDGFVDVMAYGIKQFQLWLGDGQGNWIEDAFMDVGDDPGYGNAIRAGGDLDHNGYPDLLILAQELTGTFIQFDKNILYVFAEDSPADSLWIKPVFPTGGENFYPGSVQFIKWASEVPAGEGSTVSIEISAYGPEGPWWMLAENLPNNGKHQWTVPDFGSEEVYLKFTVEQGPETSTSITPAAFTIIGEPTEIGNEIPQMPVGLFPNPGGNFVFLKNHKMIQHIRFSDVNGKPCFATDQPAHQIHLSHLPDGLYFYEIIFKNGTRLNGTWMKR